MPAAPTGDFYAIPDPLPAGTPGSPIWAELVAAPPGALAWRILYHSRTIHDEDIAVSSLVVAPDAAPPAGGFPLIAYAHGTTGLADPCAPSKSARSLAEGGDAAGDLPLPAVGGRLRRRGDRLRRTRDAGAASLHRRRQRGSGRPRQHPCRARLPEAHAGQRAVVVGISQGGHAALFTGELADTYAPDAGLLGVVALAPGAEPAQAAMLLLGDESVVGFAVAIGAGFDAAYPDIRLEDILTPKALAAIDVVDTGCIDDILATYAGPVDETLRLEGLMQPPWPALLDENTPGRARTSVPIFVGQGDADSSSPSSRMRSSRACA